MRDLQTIWHDDFKPANIELIGFSRCETYIMASQPVAKIEGSDQFSGQKIDMIFKQEGDTLVNIYTFPFENLRSENIRIFINNKSWEETPTKISPQIDITKMDEYADEIDSCKDRGAVGDLSQVAYKLLQVALLKDGELRPLRDRENNVLPASPHDLISSNRDYNDYFEREPKSKKEWQEFSEELIKLMIEKDQTIVELFNKVNNV